MGPSLMATLPVSLDVLLFCRLTAALDGGFGGSAAGGGSGGVGSLAGAGGGGAGGIGVAAGLLGRKSVLVVCFWRRTGRAFILKLLTHSQAADTRFILVSLFLPRSTRRVTAGDVKHKTGSDETKCFTHSRNSLQPNLLKSIKIY